MRNGWYEEYGNLYHYANNKFHNEKCSARIWDNGNKFWCQNGKYHRLDGPACEFNDRSKYWFYQGKRIDCNSQIEFERYLKLKLLW